MTKLSEHFTFEELTNTTHDDLIEKNKDEATKHKESLSLLCLNILEPIRNYYKAPLTVSSGFRGKELNERVGGSLMSSHFFGEAADIIVKGITPKALFDDIVNEKIPGLKKENIAQVILEKRKSDKDFTWVHISLYTERYKQARHLANKSSSPFEKLIFNGLIYRDV